MKKIKYIIPLVILFIAIGFAAISYTLNLDGNAGLAGDLDNFNVYYSNTYVNGVEDYSVITSPTELDFTTTLKEPGTTYSITYDVTNGSKHFDAQLTMTCTSGDTYMSIVNELDTSTNLEALGTRSGTITLKKLKSIASNEITAKTVSCTLTATPVERTTLGEGTAIDKQYAVLKATYKEDTTMFRAPEYKEKIKTITFQDTINVPADAIESWDIGVAQNGNVMAYLVTNPTDSTMYDLYIQANGKIYANRDMRRWFDGFTYVDVINGLELLDTSSAINMSYMFNRTGYYSTSFSLGIVPFDTSNVTNMSYMFEQAGHDSTEYLIDVSSFDTSNVTNMIHMFGYNGYSNYNFELDVSNFNTSKVTNMSYMFVGLGWNTTNLYLDLNNFDTSEVNNMLGMFEAAGHNSNKLKIDISSFDTENVQDLSFMFSFTGYQCPNFELKLGNISTSNATTLSYMFNATGSNDPDFNLNIKEINIIHATHVDGMFLGTGQISPSINITINVKSTILMNYEKMFVNAALKSGSQITVNYTSETEALVDAMIATKSEGANVVKGTLVN